MDALVKEGLRLSQVWCLCIVYGVVEVGQHVPQLSMLLVLMIISLPRPGQLQETRSQLRLDSHIHRRVFVEFHHFAF